MEVGAEHLDAGGFQALDDLGVGWPYWLPAPAEYTATAGVAASNSSWVVEVDDPWWPTRQKPR